MSKQEQFQEQAAEAQREHDTRTAALGQASQAAAVDQGAFIPNQSFLKEYGDPDISASPNADAFEQRISTELSHHQLFGNITTEERERLQLLNQALAMQVKAEHPQPMGASSKCTGQYRKELLGEDAPTMTPDMARQVDSALGQEGIRSQMQSQAVNGSAWKGMTQIQSVAITDGSNSSGDDSTGFVGSAKQFLFGDS